MREMIRAAESNHFAVMPDGPKGPRRHVELGLIYLAAKTGLPIVMLAVARSVPPMNVRLPLPSAWPSPIASVPLPMVVLPV